MNLGQILFSFQGRINRGKYWLGGAITLIPWLICFGLIGTIAMDEEGGGASTMIMAVLALVIGIALLVVGVAIGVKRLHDRDESGWFLLLFYLAPIVLDGLARGIGGLGLLLDLVSLGISIWAFIELGCLRGTVGPNRFGPDPLGPPVPQPA